MAEEKQAVKDTHLVAAIVEYSDDAIIGSTLNSTTAVRKDGSVFPVSLTVAPIHDEDGAIIGASAVHRDVSEQKRAFEVGQRMEAIVESSDEAIIATTLEGVVTSWNPAAERLFGYTTEEIIGKSAETVTPEDRPDEMKDILSKVKAGQHIDHLETIRVRKDGSVFPSSLTVSPICDAGGATVGMSMISRDMAELKHALRYARSLIEAALDPLVTISPRRQGQGITAQRHGVTIDQAYQRIHTHARNSNASLRTVAQAIVQVGLQV